MKIILTGATGVLGSHIMYDILELFIKENKNDKLFIIARNKGKVSAVNRVNELLTSDYTPLLLQKSGLEKLHEYIQMVDRLTEPLMQLLVETLLRGKCRDPFFWNLIIVR